MSHLDNSGSEDGQLRSPTDEILYRPKSVYMSNKYDRCARWPHQKIKIKKFSKKKIFYFVKKKKKILL